jgi:hypothetical protein
MKTRTPEQEAAYQRGFELARREHQRRRPKIQVDPTDRAAGDVTQAGLPDSASDPAIPCAPDHLLAEYTSDDLRAHFALGWIHAL